MEELLRHSSTEFAPLWNWGAFLPLVVTRDDALTRWYATRAAVSLLGLAAHEPEAITLTLTLLENRGSSGAARTNPATEHGSVTARDEALTVAAEALADDERRRAEERSVLFGRDAFAGLLSSASRLTGRDGGNGTPAGGAALATSLALRSSSVRRPIPQSLSHALVDVHGVVLLRHAPSLRAHKSSSSADVSAGGSAGVGGLVRVASTRRNLAALAFAAASCGSGAGGGAGGGCGVLLYGPSGAGKSALVRELARMVGGATRDGSEGNDESAGAAAGAAPSGLLELYLDENADARSLVGEYHCTSKPGEFEWRLGALAQAALAGRWVLLEDVDRAPREALAALKPLLERGVLPLPGGRGTLRAAPSFRLFATCTTSSYGASGATDDNDDDDDDDDFAVDDGQPADPVPMATAGGDVPQSPPTRPPLRPLPPPPPLPGGQGAAALWHPVAVHPLGPHELCAIAERLPSQKSQNDSERRRSRGALPRSAIRLVYRALAASRRAARGGAFARRHGATAREFFRVCRRAASSIVFDDAQWPQSSLSRSAAPGGGLPPAPNANVNGIPLTEAQRLSLAVECMDVFAGAAPTAEARVAAALALAPAFNLQPERLLERCERSTPATVDVDCDGDGESEGDDMDDMAARRWPTVRVGRVRLARHSGSAVPDSGGLGAVRGSFVPTAHALRTLERIAAAVAHGEGMGGWVPLDFVRRSASVEKRAAASDLFVPFDSTVCDTRPLPQTNQRCSLARPAVAKQRSFNGSRPQWAPPSSCSTCRSRPRARISLEAIVR